MEVKSVKSVKKKSSKSKQKRKIEFNFTPSKGSLFVNGNKYRFLDESGSLLPFVKLSGYFVGEKLMEGIDFKISIINGNRVFGEIEEKDRQYVQENFDELKWVKLAEAVAMDLIEEADGATFKHPYDSDKEIIIEFNDGGVDWKTIDEPNVKISNIIDISKASVI